MKVFPVIPLLLLLGCSPDNTPPESTPVANQDVAAAHTKGEGARTRRRHRARQRTKQAGQPSSTAQVSPVTSTNTVNCALKIYKTGQLIDQPTEADLRTAVAALDDSELGPRLALSFDGGTNGMYVTGTPRYGFGLEYHEGVVSDGDHGYASKKTDLSAETVTKVLLAYRSHAPNWKAIVEWEKLEM